MIARIAAGLAMNPAIEHRWRRVAVPITAFLFMLLVLAAASVVLMVQREEARVENRTALLTFDPSPTDLLIAHGVDSWHGNQFAIYWVEPAGGVTPVLPPGMSRLPEPGQSVVSPALDRLANSYPALAARYPHRLILGSEGLRSEDELLAYIRVPEGRSLTQDTPVVAAHAFGSPSGHEPAMQIGLPSPVNFIPVSEGTLGFLIFPGLILLVIGLASASSVRDRRFETLRWLGAPGRMLATLTTVETMLLAVPGLVVAVLLWTMVAPFLGWVPLAGHDVVRGDLALPWWLLAALFVACTVITGIVAVVIAVLGSRGATRLRPSSRRDDISPLRMIPIWLALGMISLGNILRGDIGATMIVGGLVLMVIGVPLIVPVALRALGNALTHSRHLSAMLTGRGIQRNPVRISRVFSAGAALIVIVLAGSGYLALVRHTESPPRLKTGPQSAIVQWHDPHPSDPARLANALGEGLVVPVREEDREILVGSTCRELVHYFERAECRPAEPFYLPAGLQQGVTDRLLILAHPGIKVRLVPRENVAASGKALVLDNAPVNVLDQRLRIAVMQTLPMLQVSIPGAFVQYESPLWAWLIGAIVLAMIVLTIGCLISLVDRFLATQGHRRHLLNLGVSPRRLTTLEAWLFAVPYTTIFAISFGIGVALCALIVYPNDVEMPWGAIIGTFVVAAVTGLLGTAGVALFSARSIRKNPEELRGEVAQR